MKSIIICCFILISFSKAYSQSTSHEITSTQIRQKKLKVYSDSLLMFKTTQKLPVFLFSKNFDSEKTDIPLKTHHSPECLRLAVLENIHDEELLKNIAEAISKDKNFTKIKPDYKAIPFSNYTFYDLILIRIDLIKN